MKEIVVISGKGGTGKTSITAAFAALAESHVVADCDVDAADLHLVLEPAIEQRETFVSGKQAEIRQADCIHCGRCESLCKFDAVISEDPGHGLDKLYRIDPLACEGCGVCVRFCPPDAISFEDAECGEWFVSRTRFGPMVHAKLGIAEENSGKLVSLVRSKARELAESKGLDLIIVDGPPGIGCPVIASVTGADFVLIVTEPTLSGLHDLERVRQLTKHFGIRTAACINKCDLNTSIAQRIEDYARETDTPVVGRVRYDPAVTKAQIMGASVVEYTGGPVTEEIRSMWRHVVYELG